MNIYTLLKQPQNSPYCTLYLLISNLHLNKRHNLAIIAHNIASI